MPDSKAKRGKQDRARVALKTQGYERRYIIGEIAAAQMRLNNLTGAIWQAQHQLQRLAERLRSGFPAAQKKARRGAK